jgi:hypothetical protein
MVGNIPSSAMGVAGDIVSAVTSPAQTITNLGNMALGLPQKLFPGEQGSEQVLNQALRGMGERYGSTDKALTTLEQDPVGTLMDASGVMTMGGSGAARLPGRMGQAGRAVQRTGAAIDPLNLAGNTATYAVGKLTPESLPVSLYESAAKFGTTIPSAQREAMARTALREQIPLTSKGLDKTRKLIGQLDTRINDLILDAEKSGKTIPRSAVFKNFYEIKQKLGGPKIEASNDLAQINAIQKEFVSYLDRIGKKEFTPQELQAFKVDIYKRVNFDQAFGQPTMAKEAAYKSMGKAAKQELEQVAPGIRDLNRQEGELLQLMPNLERAAARIENRDIFGIGPGIKASGGQALAGDVGAGVGAAASIFDLPGVKSRTALGLSRAQQRGANTFVDNSIQNILLRQALLQEGRLQELREKGLLD